MERRNKRRVAKTYLNRECIAGVAVCAFIC